MNKSEVLVTGATGEIGQSLITRLAAEGRYHIVALDLREPDPGLASKCRAFYRGNILDRILISEIEAKHQFEIIFHLAGLLSSSGEKNPQLAHEVNVNGSLNILQVAQNHSDLAEKPVVFVFSSSIAVYGLNRGDDRSHPVSSRQFLTPITMYGVNKLYIEQLGRYYSRFYKGGDKGGNHARLDFRCVRFPGIISPETIPTGGTSDYAPEMLHAAARGLAYECFVTPETVLPFMVMSDAVNSLLQLAQAERHQLDYPIYNVTGFSVSARDIRKQTLHFFPQSSITFNSNPLRQAIVDSWPEMIDDTPARREWGWRPHYDFDQAFEALLVPMVKRRYELGP